MYKIAILGCENSHARNFLDLIKAGEYPDIEVVGVYSEETDAAKKLNELFGVYVMNDYAELAGQLDGVMITARHGDNHYKYAKPYLNDKIPMFIDKPITCTEDDATEFMKLSKENGIRFCGGSTCAALKETLDLAKCVKDEECGAVRGGSLVCPIHMESPYGGFSFYAQHLIDVMLTIFGEDVLEVRATKRDGHITFDAYYENFTVVGTYLEKISYYGATVYGAKNVRFEKLTFTPQSFRHEMNDMADLLIGKDMKKSYESFVRPVFIMNAIMRSMESGQKERVLDVII